MECLPRARSVSEQRGFVCMCGLYVIGVCVCAYRQVLVPAGICVKVCVCSIKSSPLGGDPFCVRRFGGRLCRDRGVALSTGESSSLGFQLAL